jgi:uncharacterized OB-fold protein
MDERGETRRYVGEQSVAGGIVIEDEHGHDALAVSRCPLCGDLRYPPRALCPLDLTRSTRVALPRHGVVYEATRVDLAPKDIATPYWVGFVDVLDQVRIFARLRAPAGREPQHGDSAELTFEPVLTSPEIVFGPVFQVKA